MVTKQVFCRIEFEHGCRAAFELGDCKYYLLLDRFHIAKNMNQATDEVRATETKKLKGRESLHSSPAVAAALSALRFAGSRFFHWLDTRFPAV